MHSSTTSKSCEQNIVATLNDIGIARHDVKGKMKYSESLGKPDKLIGGINIEILINLSKKNQLPRIVV